jgi:hypothetical protein
VRRIYVLAWLIVGVIGLVSLPFYAVPLWKWFTVSSEHRRVFLIGVSVFVPILSFLWSIPARQIWKNTKGLLGLGIFLVIMPGWILFEGSESGNVWEALIIFIVLSIISLVVMSKNPVKQWREIFTATWKMTLLTWLPVILLQLSYLSSVFFFLIIPMEVVIWGYFILKSRKK